MASPVAFFVALFILFTLHVSADIVFEDGYTVSTILDGNKRNLHPHSILPQVGSSDLILLDSVNSAFYTVSFTSSQECEIGQLLDNGSGFSDGDLATATFKQPKSFALDFNGNIYVADRNRSSIRKISKSGVTTIAGGGSRMGHKDGPGRNASFSPDFELAFVPERCALMICDHGHNLIRQINLKPQDCSRRSQSGLAAPVWAWALGLGICLLIGLIIGFAARPYIYPHESSKLLYFNATWKHCLISQGRQVLMLCFDIRSAVARSRLYAFSRRFIMLSLSHLSLMFRIGTLEPQASCKKCVSLLDSEPLASEAISKSQIFAEQLKDLLTSEAGMELANPTVETLEQEDENEQRDDVCSNGNPRIDNMIQANIMGFARQAERAPLEESFGTVSGLVKRR